MKKCKHCGTPLRLATAYDVAWYECPKCRAIFEQEELWELDKDEVIDETS